MKRCVRRVCLLISTLLFFASASATLSVDHDAGTITSVDGDDTWVYTLSTGSWTWDNSTNSWTYDGTSKEWSEDAGSDYCTYDETYDVWVQSTDGSYDLDDATTFNHQVWQYNATTKKWHFASRQESPLGFTTVSAASWSYNSSSGRWEYARTADDSFTYIPTAQEWTFDTGATLQWAQASPATGATWNYNNSTQRFIEDSSGDANTWALRESGNDEIIWELLGQDAGMWDRVEWRYRVATGSWGELGVQEAPLTYAPVVDWAYDTGTDAWYAEGGVDGVPDTGTSPRHLMPLFPPTPLAPQKAIIDDTIADLLATGVNWGSADGTGDGLIDASDNSFITNGVFVFDTLNKLTMVDTVKLDGDLELHVKQDGILTLGDGSESGDVIITPADGAAHSQLIFNVEAGKTLEVQVLNDVSFLANDVPLFLSFRGRGTTLFRVPSGKVITFAPADADAGTEGVRIQVLMELGAADVDNRVSQLVFAPFSYEEQTGDGAVNTDQSQTTWLQLGRHSSISFVSQNDQGVNEDTYPGYGAIGFDVAHAGVGRTILDMAAGKTMGDMLDAGVNVYGNLITGSGPGDTVVAQDFRDSVAHNKRAGIRASINIIDDVAFASVVSDASSPTTEQANAWVARDTTARRGLVVLNHNISYPRLLANLEQADTLENSAWAQHSRPYHPGFIIGNNGQIDVSHNLFFDYVGASINKELNPEYLGGTGKTDAQVKVRNASALIIDGFGQYDPSTDTSYDMAYVGHQSPYKTEARITLRGSAGLFARCGASASTGEVLQAVEEVTGEPDKLDATIGQGTYNGVYAPVLNTDGTRSAHEVIQLDTAGNPVISDEGDALCLDGEHAIDVEGPLTIRSVLGRFGFAPNGYINVPSIRLDHTGAEIVEGG